MRRVLLTLAGLVLATQPVQAARDGDAGAGRGGIVQQLIAELGSDQYAVRRRAEEQLIRMGPEAYDALKAAENNDDLEIADRVRYIVQRMRVQWVRSSDGADVRQALARYGDLSEDGRSERIRQLAALEGGAGLAALCRIARFDQSPLVARRAALAMLKQELSADERRAVQDACLVELGTSQRPPAIWMRLYLRELDEPQETIAAWAEATAAEAALLRSDSTEVSFDTVLELLDRHLERCHALDLSEETSAALFAIVEMTVDEAYPQQLTEGLRWALGWIIRTKRWDALDRVETRFETELRENRKLLYYLAAAVNRAGRTDRAEKLAEQAFRMDGDDEDERVGLAEKIADLGFVPWAEREYRRAIDSFPVLDVRSMDARSDLALWLYDREDYEGAARLLGEFCDALESDDVGKQRLLDEIDRAGSAGRELLRNISARREYYLACVDESRRDYARQRERLELAAAAYEQDPDILIALYRIPEADDAFREQTRLRIRRTAKFMQALIDEYPESPSYYNQWAWLIANTEGDQQRAVEYSRRSLELAPDEPSYLDTLGRCYYAVGDYEQAVKYQRQAVEAAPHFGVMRRQLALFERAQAERRAK